MVALQSFGGAFVPLLLGIVLVAAGLRLAIAAPWRAAGTDAAWLLAGGVGLYLGGEAIFRVSLGIRPVGCRFAGAGVCAACGFLGGLVPAAAFVCAARSRWSSASSPSRHAPATPARPAPCRVTGPATGRGRRARRRSVMRTWAFGRASGRLG